MNAALTECSSKQVDKKKQLLKQTLANDVQTPQKRDMHRKLRWICMNKFGPSGVSGNEIHGMGEADSFFLINWWLASRPCGSALPKKVEETLNKKNLPIVTYSLKKATRRPAETGNLFFKPETPRFQRSEACTTYL